MSPIILPSGKVLSARTTASARAGAERPEGERVKGLMAQLKPVLALQFRALRQQAAEAGRANPRGWADQSFFYYGRCVLDGQLACDAVGVPVESLEDLASSSAVQAIVARYMTNAGSGQNASRILRGLRTVVRRGGANTPRPMRKAIRDMSRTARRGEYEDLPEAAECLAAAMAEFRDAVVMIATGHPRRGKTRLRDAIIMALEIATSFRRSEFGAITVDVVFFSSYKTEVKIIIPEGASKVREVQLGVIRDEQVVAMLQRLVVDTGSGSLFRTNWKAPLAPDSTYKALRRTAKRSVGVPLSFNKARRIRVTGETSLPAMRARARHHRNSEVAEKTYSWHDDDLGIDQCRDALKNFGLPSE